MNTRRGYKINGLWEEEGAGGCRGPGVGWGGGIPACYIYNRRVRCSSLSHHFFHFTVCSCSTCCYISRVLMLLEKEEEKVRQKKRRKHLCTDTIFSEETRGNIQSGSMGNEQRVRCNWEYLKVN